ncbi:MAG: hybrid sensor histidine kinase/response regulator [Candidatus Zixiibacteriota bacterium]
MKTAIRVLVIEDSEEDAMLILRELRRGGFDPTYRVIERPEEMQHALSCEDWELIIADYSMPHFNGAMALEMLKSSSLDIPFILVSGKIGEEVAVEAMKAGAHDYIMKGNLARLAPAIVRELREVKVRYEHRQIEKKLKLTERLRYVGSVAASIIHDLKQPMQVILSCADAVCSEDTPVDERKQLSGEITTQVRRMLNMSQEILDYASGERRLRLSPVDLDQLCREVVELFRPQLAADKVRVRYSKWSAEITSPTLNLDRDRFWRVLVNLIGNACDAMPNGGELTVCLSLDQNCASIEIQDTGVGIPASIQSTLYDPFVTEGKEYGTGLGLSIVKSIVEAHNGSITFTSSPTAGTAFKIILRREVGSAQNIAMRESVVSEA